MFAIPETCVFVDGQSATNMLTACGAGTHGIDPLADSDGKEGIKNRIITIAQVAITLWALLAVGAIVWAGIQYTYSYGEDEKLKKAKSTALFALIGLVLIMWAFPFVDIFINFIYRIAWM